MSLYEEIERYVPFNEQEEHDKRQMLAFIQKHPTDYLLRSNEIAHFSVSIWVVNERRDKVLMIYHNIYDSWSWIGGHADGVEDLKEVAMRELEEETGVKHARLLTDDILSLESLTVDGHVKRGAYVPSHLHLNLTYLAEAQEDEVLAVKPDENSGVRWCTLNEAITLPSESWMVQRIYQKLIEKMQKEPWNKL